MQVQGEISRRFAIIAAVVMALLSLVPFLFGIANAPSGSQFIGYPYATDDHMVYAAWMRQAQDLNFLMDNRFTTDAQPGLTIHIYFFLLGVISKFIGIPLTTALAKAVFTGLFVWLTYKLLARFKLSPYATKLTLTLVCLGGGIGFTVWHQFGEAIVRPAPTFLSSLMSGRLPTDVWQPEGFVFPSALTNSLFMVSLCLIVGVILALLESRESWKPVLWGAPCMLVLMNIHSYDVLMLLAATIGFLCMSAYRKQITGAWLLRGAAIFAGALPAALWFVHVLKSDAVFQARAATPTYAPNFKAVVFGYLLLVALAVFGIYQQKRRENDSKGLTGIGLFVIVVLGLFGMAGAQAAPGYFLSPAAFAGVMVAVLVALVLISRDDMTWNFLASWGLVGLVVVYFPALFQRKLAMGLSVPWAILAGLAIVAFVEHREQGRRNLVSVFALLLLCGSSFLWLQRELGYIRQDVSRTTVHPLYLTSDVQRILEHLNKVGGRKVAIAMPGVPSPVVGDSGEPIPDQFGSPLIPDLNPVLSGFTGAYTYAGHWSETPQYNNRRNQTQKFFMADTDDAWRREFLSLHQVQYIVAPNPLAYEELGRFLADVTPMGEVVVDGAQFKLIKVQP